MTARTLDFQSFNDNLQLPDMQSESARPEGHLLVIGYGSTLRSDDAAGRKVAEAIEALQLPSVSVISRDLLTAELAEPISHASEVVFVDASVEPGETVRVRTLAPAESSQILAHAADPRTLLALARDVFGQAPPAWWVTIPVENLGIGEQISAKAESGIEKAIQQVKTRLVS